jgi:hypothetical protein
VKQTSDAFKFYLETVAFDGVVPLVLPLHREVLGKRVGHAGRHTHDRPPGGLDVLHAQQPLLSNRRFLLMLRVCICSDGAAI